jgi:hypothetical protein
VLAPAGTTRDTAKQAVTRLLAPFQEFETGDASDEFAQLVNRTEELRTQYLESTIEFLKDASGTLIPKYDERFFREPTPQEEAKIGPLMGSGGGNGMYWESKDWGDGKGYCTRIHFVPDTWTEVAEPRPKHTTFAQYASEWHGFPRLEPEEAPALTGTHKYGWTRLDDRGEVVEVIDRTNPNGKWDWFSVGGCWTGWLGQGITGSYDAETDPRNFEPCRICHGNAKAVMNCRACGKTGVMMKYAGDFFQEHEQDVVSTRLLLNTTIDHLPRALVDPTGKWHEREGYGDPGMEWMVYVRALYAMYPDTVAVAVDCHV